MNMNLFGERLTGLRRDRGMTQEEFSSRLGVTQQAISKWERGQSLPDTSLLDGICSILKVSADELLNIESESLIVEDHNIQDQNQILNNLFAEPIHLIFSKDLLPIITEMLNIGIFTKKRLELAEKKGFLIPLIRVRDEPSLSNREYQIDFYGKVMLKQEASDKLTATILAEELFSLIEEHYAKILNKQIVKMIVDHIKFLYPGAADGLIPDAISYLLFKQVLSEIIYRGGNLKNIFLILEGMEKNVLQNKITDPQQIADDIIRRISNF